MSANWPRIKAAQSAPFNAPVTTELDVLNRVSAGLTAQGLPFMLTGSYSFAHYATALMTRAIDDAFQ